MDHSCLRWRQSRSCKQWAKQIESLVCHDAAGCVRARASAESEVRASVAFQVSRLATLMSKALRDAANMDAWDGLVTGEPA